MEESEKASKITLIEGMISKNKIFTKELIEKTAEDFLEKLKTVSGKIGLTYQIEIKELLSLFYEIVFYSALNKTPIQVFEKVRDGLETQPKEYIEMIDHFIKQCESHPSQGKQNKLALVDHINEIDPTYSLDTLNEIFAKTYHDIDFHYVNKSDRFEIGSKIPTCSISQFFQNEASTQDGERLTVRSFVFGNNKKAFFVDQTNRVRSLKEVEQRMMTFKNIDTEFVSPPFKVKDLQTADSCLLALTFTNELHLVQEYSYRGKAPKTEHIFSDVVTFYSVKITEYTTKIPQEFIFVAAVCKDKNSTDYTVRVVKLIKEKGIYDYGKSDPLEKEMKIEKDTIKNYSKNRIFLSHIVVQKNYFLLVGSNETRENDPKPRLETRYIYLNPKGSNQEKMGTIPHNLNAIEINLVGYMNLPQSEIVVYLLRIAESEWRNNKYQYMIIERKIGLRKNKTQELELYTEIVKNEYEHKFKFGKENFNEIGEVELFKMYMDQQSRSYMILSEKGILLNQTFKIERDGDKLQTRHETPNEYQFLSKNQLMRYTGVSMNPSHTLLTISSVSYAYPTIILRI